MLSKLIADQQKYVNAFFQGLDIAKMEALVEKLAAHSGMLFFSGIGKSGYIAQKIASTLISTGTKALYIFLQQLCVMPRVAWEKRQTTLCTFL